MTVIEVLETLNIPFKRHGESPHVSQGWVGIVCPYCDSGQGKFGLGINLQGMYCSCWKCGSHSFVSALTIASGEKYARIKELLGDVVQGVEDDKPQVRGKLIFPPGVGPLGAPHVEYLSGRGFDPIKLYSLWEVKGIGYEGGNLAWRLFIPIIFRGETVSWTTRTVIPDPSIPRYRSARPDQEKIHHKDLLYGEDFCRHAIVVCEGVTDVWRIGPGAVATFGTTVTAAQKFRIAKYPVRIYCFDNEPEARRRSKALANELAIFPGETYNLSLSSGKDPGDASEDDIAQIRKLLK